MLNLYIIVIHCLTIITVYHSHSIYATSDQDIVDNTLCSPWSVFNTTTKTCHCSRQPLPKGAVVCTEEGTSLEAGYCMTFDEEAKTRLAQCPYLGLSGYYNITKTLRIQLPPNKTELIEYMCRPLNRNGTVCRHCIHGFGPALTSIGYKCHNCTDVWYGIPLYIVVEFLPLTVFYLAILSFQVRLTSPTMTCFIMCSQFILYDLMVKFLEREKLVLQTNSPILIRAAIAIHGIWNLELTKYALPGFCVSRKLLPIHIIFLNYASAIYPLVLIFITYIAVELHGHNFKPIVFLWKPFHRCCAKLRRGWNAKSDMIDVFATFFILSFSKFMYQSFELLGCQHRYRLNTNEVAARKVALFDLNAYCFSRRHLPFAIFSIIFLVIFVCLPTLCILLYPFKLFRAALLRCTRHNRFESAIHFFADRFYSRYRDGLNDDRDMRSFACLYFVLMPVIMIHHHLHHIYPEVGNPSFIEVILFFSGSLLIALTRPYKSNKDTIINSVMLALVAFRSLVMCVYRYDQEPLSQYMYLIIILATTMLPQVIFWMFIIIRIMIITCKVFGVNRMCKKLKRQNCEEHNIIQKSNQESQILVEPKEITISHYGCYH